MKQKIGRRFWIAAAVLAAFALFTLAVCTVDVQPIGPEGSSVGFAKVNGAFHALTGVHWALYTLTDWLGLVPVAVGLGFAGLGLKQWLCRKSLAKVDRSLFVLAGYYVVVLAAYLLFEELAVNYRPVTVEGRLEASYPSSTTLLVLCVMPAAMLQLRGRIRRCAWRGLVLTAFGAFTAFMVAGRLVSGVHWLTDILGGGLLSTGLILLYDAAVRAMEKQKR